jgi:hypothetical protein
MDLSSYVVKIRKNTKRITLQRFLVSKIAYGKEVTMIDIAAIFHNQLWLQTKCSLDPLFQKKFGNSLEELTKILKNSNFSRGLSEGALLRMKEQLLIKNGDFLFPLRNLHNLEAMLKNSVYTRWREPEGTEVHKLPPVKYIGKGYRDHGTARRSEEDGSPAWQEVASKFSDLEREHHFLSLKLIQFVETGEMSYGITGTVKLIKRVSEVYDQIKRIDPNWRSSLSTKATKEANEE